MQSYAFSVTLGHFLLMVSLNKSTQITEFHRHSSKLWLFDTVCNSQWTGLAVPLSPLGVLLVLLTALCKTSVEHFQWLRYCTKLLPLVRIQFWSFGRWGITPLITLHPSQLCLGIGVTSVLNSSVWDNVWNYFENFNILALRILILQLSMKGLSVSVEIQRRDSSPEVLRNVEPSLCCHYSQVTPYLD